jgi:hypothetical protein
MAERDRRRAAAAGASLSRKQAFDVLLDHYKRCRIMSINQVADALDVLLPLIKAEYDRQVAREREKKARGNGAGLPPNP